MVPTWDSGSVGVLVDILHVLHEGLTGHAKLLADGAAGRVGASHEGGVLRRKRSENVENSQLRRD